MNSELPAIFEFSENDVDWDLCDEIASTNSEIKAVCNAYKNNNCASNIAKQFNHNVHTVLKYLEKGAKCGYCDYEPNNIDKNGRKNIWQNSAKPIYCETDDIYFMSKNHCEEYYTSLGECFNGNSIYSNINKHIPYKGRMFKYISKSMFNNLVDKSKYDNSIQIYGDKYLEKYIKEE